MDTNEGGRIEVSCQPRGGGAIGRITVDNRAKLNVLDSQLTGELGREKPRQGPLCLAT